MFFEAASAESDLSAAHWKKIHVVHIPFLCATYLLRIHLRQVKKKSSEQMRRTVQLGSRSVCFVPGNPRQDIAATTSVCAVSLFRVRSFSPRTHIHLPLPVIHETFKVHIENIIQKVLTKLRRTSWLLNSKERDDLYKAMIRSGMDSDPLKSGGTALNHLDLLDRQQSSAAT